MRIRYRYARSLLAGFLAVVLLFSLVLRHLPLNKTAIMTLLRIGKRRWTVPTSWMPMLL